ncbi:MAG: phosphate ABC transporter substrate-binding protein [Bacteroidota bacterium]|nr:phosphate ABC transporter substrate-binding protein [Bacteroidota bacterium]
MKTFSLITRSSVYFLFFFVFVNCTDSSSTEKEKAEKQKKLITIKGSDSELNLLKFFADEYKANRPGLIVNVSGGGTSHGIKALINNETDIAIASRIITEEEITSAKAKGVNPLAFIIAQDIVAIITHPETGIDSLSLSQLSKIMKGTIINWKELGGIDLPIKIYGRDKHSGTRYYLKDKLGVKKFPAHYEELDGNAQIIEKIHSEKGSMGYVNVGSIVNVEGKPTSKVWAMNLYIENNKACSPYENQRIKYGEYPLVRPLIQYTNGKPSNELLEFINFELLERQQSNLEKHGYLKINATYFNMNQNSLNN